MKKEIQYPITVEPVSPARNASQRSHYFKQAGSQSDDRVKRDRTRRPRGPAKVIAPSELQRVLDYIAEKSTSPEADRVKILLSVYAGLRACEISGLRMADVTDASGRITSQIQVRSDTAKNGRPRSVPMHPEIRKAIEAFRAALPDTEQLAVSGRYTIIKSQSVNSVTVWFFWIYKKAGLKGCSSHSGRRSFITALARVANTYGNSLRDVQILAGHARIDTTESYIEPSENLTDLVNSIGKEPRKRRGRTAP